MSERLAARQKSLKYHRPSDAVQRQITFLREMYLDVVEALDQEVPECRELSLAYTRLEESLMWATKGLCLMDKDAEVLDPPSRV